MKLDVEKKADQPSSMGYASAAWLLMCEERAMRAVARVESGPLGAFLESGVPVVLFERHIFHRLTDGRFDNARATVSGILPAYAEISSPHPGMYGPTSIQHAKLAAACLLDREAALKSASWGLFQIMGMNHEAAGYPSLQRFVNAMYRSADDHLRAFVMFIRHNDRLVDAIRALDWSEFARIYNGPAYAQNKYDTKLAAAYAQIVIV